MALLLCAGALGQSHAALPPEADSDPKAFFAESITPLFNDYCLDCHDADTTKGGFNLEGLIGNEAFLPDRTKWERVMEVILTREMPPEKKRQPEQEERDLIVEFIDQELGRFNCDEVVDPGKVTLRRLNKSEYKNTIRDLVGVDFDPAATFPNDEVGYGFDNIGDVLSLSPMLMEKYLGAAEEIANSAIELGRDTWPPLRVVEGEKWNLPGDQDAVRHTDNALGLYREGEGSIALDLENGGTYLLRFKAWGDQAGPEPPRMGVRLGDEELKRFDVRSTSSKPSYHEIKKALDPGRHVLAVSFLNNYVVNNSPDPALNGDRNLFLDRFELVGPLETPQPEISESHRMIIPVPPLPGREIETAKDYLTDFTSRAFRRPAQANEVDRLLDFVKMALADGGSFEEGMQLALQAVLVSPHFLYRWELQPEGVESPDFRLNDYQIASRLSYFLWSSMPDEILLEAAASGKLQDRAQVESQALRMIQDPKAYALVENFAGQWLQVRNLDEFKPDPEMFPEFNDLLRISMKKETELFFESIMKEDRSLLELLDSDYTFVDSILAEHYGMQPVSGQGFQRVKFDENDPRGGVLTQASILTVTSNPTRTSPVNRGKWVLEQILGTPPPPPPPDVPELEDNEEASETASLRERLELHRQKAECATCHAKMDPIGFAFENFDAIGRWRDVDGKFPIDSSGVLPSGESFSGPQGLIGILKSNDKFVRSLVEKMLTFALGRGLEYYDQCAVEDIHERVLAEDNRFSALVLGIVNSKPFLLKSTDKAAL